MAYLREYTWYWHEGIEGGGWRILETPCPIPGYEYIPPPVGTEIYLGPGWVNDSEVPVTGHLVVRTHSPSGVLHDYFIPDETLDPDTGKFTTLPPFILNEAGTWEMEVWLIIDDVALDYKIVPFVTEAPVEISTSLTITAPATVEPEETFNISGTLSETGTGNPIPNQTISLSYNGISLGNTLTDTNGDYQIQAFISTEGTYTLKAAFAGTTTLAASESTSKLQTGAPTLATLVPAAAIGLLAYMIFFRK